MVFRNDLDSFEDSDKQLHVDLAETKYIHCTDRRQYKNGEQLIILCALSFALIHSNFAFTFLKSWDRASTPTESMERMSMENAEDVVKESEPYGIDVSYCSMLWTMDICIYDSFTCNVRFNCWR